MYIFSKFNTYNMNAHTHTHTHACVHVHTHKHTYIHTHLHAWPKKWYDYGFVMNVQNRYTYVHINLTLGSFLATIPIN